jgi:DNA-binding transcriptional LysR family regulator
MWLRVAFDAFLPVARWAPLFQVLCLERPGLRLDWQPTALPSFERPLLGDADVGLFVQPPPREGLSAHTIEVSPMAVVMAVGHPLSRDGDELKVDDILEETFPGGPRLDRDYTRFWTLDDRRGGPPPFTEAAVEDAQQGLEEVVAGRAIVTLPATLAGALPHPGVIALPLTDGPMVETRLVWRSEDRSAAVDMLVGLVRDWTPERRDGR